MMSRYSVCIALLGAILAAGFLVHSNAKKTTVDSVGWSATALMFVYHTGVLEELENAHLYRPSKMPLAGCSGGSFIAMATGTGTKSKTIHDEAYNLLSAMTDVFNACKAADASKSDDQCNPAFGGLGAYVAKSLNVLITNNTRKLKSANKRISVAITLLTGKVSGEPIPSFYPNDECSLIPQEAWIVSKFDGRDDIIGALKSSSFYSGVSSPNCSINYRGKHVRDGGFTKHLPCPKSGKNCLKVEAIYMPQYQDVSCNGVTGRQVFNGTYPDIYPGLSGKPLPMAGQCEWVAATTSPWIIYKQWDEIKSLAKADAKAWLKRNGWV